MSAEAYTIGAIASYDRALAERKKTGKEVTKLGAYDDYEGGIVWQSLAEVEHFLSHKTVPFRCGIYRLDLPASWEESTYRIGDNHYLRVDARIVARVRATCECNAVGWDGTIGELGHVAFKIARNAGWWPDDVLQRTRERDPRQILTALCLVHREVSEACEDVRNGAFAVDQTEAGKPVGLPSELADVVIRVANLAHGMGIDLQEAIAEKLAYNATRSHRHGGKSV